MRKITKFWIYVLQKRGTKCVTCQNIIVFLHYYKNLFLKLLEF